MLRKHLPFHSKNYVTGLAVVNKQSGRLPTSVNQEADKSSESEKLRLEGNGFYKSKSIAKAIECYQEAAALAPGDPSPHSDLSAARYEQGFYSDCIADIHTAERLTADKSSSTTEKLRYRLCKAHLQIGDHQAALQALEELPKSKETTILQKYCSKSKESASLNQVQYRRKLIQSLPRYLPDLGSDREYYVVGHDDACSQVDADMLDQCEGPISLMFAGIGDARDLYATLIKIIQLEDEGPEASPREYHMTINDVKPETLARNLLMFCFLDDLERVDASNGKERTDILTTIFFLYIAAVMPQHLADRIQDAIKRTTLALNSGRGLPQWLHIYDRDKAALTTALKSWRGRLKTKYTVAEVTRLHLDHSRSHEPQLLEEAASIDEGSECEREKRFFVKIGAHQGSKAWTQRHESALLPMYSNEPHWSKALEHVNREWAVNVTMLDDTWLKGPDGHLISAVLTFDPFSIMERFYKYTGLKAPVTNPTIYAHFSKFFTHVAAAIGDMRHRLVVEVVFGEVSEVLDGIRFKFLDRPDDFPSQFNQIHLSNIPDYIGGPLTTVLFALPVAKDNVDSAVTSSCLLNTPLWRGLPEYYTEYMLISEPETVRKLTNIIEIPNQAEDVAFPMIQTTLCSLSQRARQVSGIDDILRAKGLEAVLDMDEETLKKADLRSMMREKIDIRPDGREISHYLSDYVRWARSSDFKLDWASLLPRASLQRWLFALFFKIVLPVDRFSTQPKDLRVWSPLNLTIFFRLILHLKDLGYPAHWLSDILEQLIENRVVTTARPPKTSPLTIAELQTEMPMKQLSTAPFATEMATLAIMFQPTLAFPIFTTSLPKSSSIHSYRINLCLWPPKGPDYAVNILVFVNTKLLKLATGCDLTSDPIYAAIHNTFDLRAALHPEFKNKIPKDKRQEAHALQDKGLRVLTTLNWNRDTEEATFWMREELMNEMLASGEWVVAMWRTDNWKMVTFPHEIDSDAMIEKGSRWFE